MKMKAVALAISLAIGGTAFVPNVSATGIPVIDAANLQQTIMQYMNMIEQLKQLEAQLKQAKEQYAAITGLRDMAQLARTESYIPKSWQETLAIMDGGGEIGGLAEQIREGASKLNQDYFANVSDEIKEGLDSSMKSAATGQALNAKVYDSSQERVQRLTELANKVDSAQDLKAVSDLQARIGVETAMLMNELIKLQSMNALIAKRDDVRENEAIQSSFKLRSRSY